MQDASIKLTAVFALIVSPNRIHPIEANTITPIEKPKILDSHSDPLKAVIKLFTLCM
jgi:hypothetical protein